MTLSFPCWAIPKLLEPQWNTSWWWSQKKDCAEGSQAMDNRELQILSGWFLWLVIHFPTGGAGGAATSPVVRSGKGKVVMIWGATDHHMLPRGTLTLSWVPRWALRPIALMLLTNPRTFSGTWNGYGHHSILGGFLNCVSVHDHVISFVSVINDNISRPNLKIPTCMCWVLLPGVSSIAGVHQIDFPTSRLLKPLQQQSRAVARGLSVI